MAHLSRLYRTQLEVHLAGKRLAPLKGYSDIPWERPKSRRRPRESIILSSSTDAFSLQMTKSFGEFKTSAGQRLGEKRQALVHPVIDTAVVIAELLGRQDDFVIGHQS